jgi:hypothetical protein
MSILDDWSEELNAPAKSKKISTPSKSNNTVREKSPASILDQWEDELDNPLPRDELDFSNESTAERIGRGAKEVGQQAVKGTASGALGGWGNVLELTTINPPEDYQHPGEKAVYDYQAELLDKPKETGQPMSASDIYSLSMLSDNEFAPRPGRLPTSQDIEKTIEEYGGPGQPTTPEGKFANRAGQIYGNTLSFGINAPVSAAAGGAAGQAVEEVGGGPLLQATAEIITILATQGKSVSSALTSKDPVIRARINALKKIGYTDQDITLALNAEKAGTNRVKRAKATGASEKAFEGALERSEGLFNETLENAFPGYGKGTEHLHQTASDAYGEVARGAKNITIKDPSRFQKTIENVVQRVKNTLGENPDAAPFLKRLEDASIAAAHQPNADTYINFYKELNKMGKWLNPKEKEIFITHVKNGIKSTFRNAGPEGKVLAEKFEKVNKGIQRAYQAEAVSDLIGKSTTAEGNIDWNKMHKSFKNKKTWETLDAGLGKDQAKNLHKISKLAKDVGQFQKKLGSAKSAKMDAILDKGLWYGFAGSLWTHNSKYGLIAGSAKLIHKIGKEAYSRLQTKLLTDPKYQNITIRALEALKAGSPEALQRTSNSLERALQEDGYDINDFY